MISNSIWFANWVADWNSYEDRFRIDSKLRSRHVTDQEELWKDNEDALLAHAEHATTYAGPQSTC